MPFRKTGRALFFVLIMPTLASADATVVFTVREADGRPFAEKSVVVGSAYRHPLRMSGGPPPVRTDADGVVRFPLVEATDRLRVTAPSVGFAVTDFFEPVGRGEIFVELPRLVPFGAIEGVLPAELRGAAVTVGMQDGGSPRRTADDATVRPDGRFSFVDLFPGRYRLRVKSATETLPWVAAASVYPGEGTREVTFEFDSRPTVAVEPPVSKNADSTPREAKSPSPFVWFRGTVRDAKGSAFSGARVYAVGRTRSLLRSQVVVLAATTNDRGRWEIRDDDPGRQLAEGTSLFAVVEGRPPARRSCDVQSARTDSHAPLEQPHEFDLIVPATGGSLHVRLLRDAEPVVCATCDQQVSPFFPGSPQGEAAEAVGRLLCPAVVTDAQGWARFAGLQPGTYGIFAMEDPHRATEAVRRGGLGGWGADDDAEQSIPVRAGEATKYLFEIPPRPTAVRVNVRRRDGGPLAETSGFATRQHNGLRSSQATSGGLELDAAGSGSLDVRHFGLQHVSVSFPANSWGTYPRRRGSSFDGRAVLAASPLLEGFPASPLTVELRRPGSLRIELRDAAGKPARGFVASPIGGSEPPVGGGTGDDGVLVWQNVPDTMSLTAYLPDLRPPSCDDAAPFASDDTLTGVRLMNRTAFGVPDNQQTTLVFEPRPVGYLRGRVHPAPGRTAADYRIAEPDTYSVLQDYRTRYDAATGEFLLGPFTVGSRDVHLVAMVDGRSQPA